MTTSALPASESSGSIAQAIARTACAAFAMTLSACHAQTPATPTTPTASTSASETDSLRRNPKVKALMDKTLKNLRFIEGGSFEMGDFGPKHSEDRLYYSSQPENKPLHKVTLTSFSMSAYKTSYEDHDVFSEAMGREKLGMDRLTQRSRFPNAAAGMNWFQAREYCQWLGALLKLPMDLPTEAQWEYAARNRGQFVLFATDNGKLEDGRNVWDLEQREAQIEKLGAVAPPSMPLGQFPPTPLGLYDMTTDGYEWMLDWFSPDYYAHSPELNPAGPTKGTKKVLRSSRSAPGTGLAAGDGMTIARRQREPDPPKINVLSGRPDPTYNVSQDTTARCVVNLERSVSATR